jgi:tRNA(adenine34) deaminase
MTFTQEQQEYYMREALKEAQLAFDQGDVPIGAVIVDQRSGEIIGRAHNQREADQMATHHAEITAINQANQYVKNWRLTDHALFVTVEPCVMCSGAIGLARLPEIYYGAANEKFGGTTSLYQILADPRLNHQTQVHTGILEVECAQLMQEFFSQSRKAKPFDYVKQAHKIAIEAHKGQKDRGGKNYIRHPEFVASLMTTDQEKAAAFLHDVLEDTAVTKQDLLDQGIPPQVVEAVQVLTKQRGEPYQAYLERVKLNPISKKVKLGDLKHNSDLGRLKVVTDKDRARKVKYQKAMAFLEDL